MLKSNIGPYFQVTIIPLLHVSQMRNVISIVKKREIKDIVPCLLLITFLLYYSRLSVQETVLFTMDWDFLYQLTIKTIICGLVHSPTWSRWFLIRFSSRILSYMKSHLKLTSIRAICLSEINLLIYLIITSSGISFLENSLISFLFMVE